MNVSVISSGSWGTAVAILLASNGHSVKLWSWQKEESDRLRIDNENKEFLPGVMLPSGIDFTCDLAYACKADLVISALPSHAIRKTVEQMKELIKKDQIVLNISKGLEPETLKRISEIFKEELPQAKIAVLSGPAHAEEVARGVPTACVVSSDDQNVTEFVQDIFMCSTFRVYTNPDIIGVELGASLKNVIALCAGISDGLGCGDNTKAALMTRGLVEIIRLGEAMGANAHTFNGLTGVGDLIVTCTSMHSRNRRAGILIGKGYTLTDALNEVHMVVEGVTTAKAAYELSKKYNVEMPIITEAYNILYNGKSPKDAVMDLMQRNKKNEIL